MIASPNIVPFIPHLMGINKQNIETKVAHTAVLLSGHLEPLQIVVLIDVGYIGGWGYS